jgi:hypothetical protein
MMEVSEISASVPAWRGADPRDSRPGRKLATPARPFGISLHKSSAFAKSLTFASLSPKGFKPKRVSMSFRMDVVS